MKRRSNKRVIFLLKCFPKSPFFRGRSMAKRLRNESFELDVMETVKRCNSAIYCPSTRLVTCHHPFRLFARPLSLVLPHPLILAFFLRFILASFLSFPPSCFFFDIFFVLEVFFPSVPRYFRRSPPHHAYPPLSSTRPKNPLLPSPSFLPTH